MFSFLNQIGIFGLPMLVIALTVLFLTAKFGVRLWGNNADPNVDINSVIYLGILAVSMGVFSHFLGMYQASGIMAQLRAEQIAAGYAQSLLALLYGFGIFFISATCWFVLRYRVRKLQVR